MKIDYHKSLVSCLSDEFNIKPSDVITIWFSKTVENAKGLFITDKYDYYEVTYHGKRDVFYIDVYEKMTHHEIKPKYKKEAE